MIKSRLHHNERITAQTRSLTLSQWIIEFAQCVVHLAPTLRRGSVRACRSAFAMCDRRAVTMCVTTRSVVTSEKKGELTCR